MLGNRQYDSAVGSPSDKGRGYADVTCMTHTKILHRSSRVPGDTGRYSHKCIWRWPTTKSLSAKCGQGGLVLGVQPQLKPDQALYILEPIKRLTMANPYGFVRQKQFITVGSVRSTAALVGPAMLHSGTTTALLLFRSPIIYYIRYDIKAPS